MTYNVALGVEPNLVVWRFPYTTKCPRRDCELSFQTREMALLHFRQEHAATSTVCHACKEVVSINADHSHNLKTLRKNLKINELAHVVIQRTALLDSISFTSKELLSRKVAMGYNKKTATQVI